MTGIVIAVGWLLYLAIRAVTREPPSHAYPVGEMLESRFGLDEPRRNQLARADRGGADLRPRHLRAALPDAAVGILRRRHPRLVQVALLRHRDRPVPHLARPHPARHRAVHRAAVRDAADPALAARAGAAAAAHGPRHRQLHRHRGWLCRHRARGPARRLLCRLRHHQSRHRRRRAVARHRLRPAVDRQQLRLRPDPADRAPDQGRRPASWSATSRASCAASACARPRSRPSTAPA